MNRKELWERIFQGVKVAVCALLTLTFLAVAILEMIPSENIAVRVKKQFEANSSMIYADGSLYQTEIRGTLENTETQQTLVESITVVVSDGKTKRKVEIDPVVLSAGEVYEVVFPIRDACDFDRVQEVYVRVNGTDTRLSNRSAVDFPISGIAVVCLLLTVGAALLTVRSIRTCYYLRQERLAKR